MPWRKLQESASVRSSVREDWCAHLPDDKRLVFESIVRDWEDAYAVFSVPLDEALSLRSEGRIQGARGCVDIAASVVSQLSEALGAACRTLEKWGPHLPAPPAVAALNPSFYRGQAARQNAQWNNVTHRILFGRRSRFLHKLRVLQMIVSALGEEFHNAAEELSSGLHVSPDALWPRLDELQYDVNTCLRETIVVLKSFIRALPPDSLATFHGELNAAASTAREAVRAPLSRVPR